MQEDIEGHRPIYRSLVDSSDDLLESCQELAVSESVRQIQSDVKGMIDRWSKVNQFYLERRRQVSDAEHVVKKYRSLLLPVENELNRVERRLEECEFEGVNAEVGKKKLESVKVQFRRKRMIFYSNDLSVSGLDKLEESVSRLLRFKNFSSKSVYRQRNKEINSKNRKFLFLEKRN